MGLSKGSQKIAHRDISGQFFDTWGFGSLLPGLCACLQVAEFSLSVLEGTRSRWLAIRKKKQGKDPNPRKSRQSAHERFLPPPKFCVFISCLSDWLIFLGQDPASCWRPVLLPMSPPTKSRIAKNPPRALRQRWAHLRSARQTTAGLKEAAKESR